eukprot:CAMPEP_0119379588 /NCGR_PEP_ID=MMETSP1334-20130426/53408_1 /TAXON_ID=127549 /ORGANISM="Calcidiscus leptoporus, Strain RCC1130" /LENGTH=36 /DNA_ID= /DNA_START= /DNA_END= /DNA_ORIENTATION=
MLRGARKVRRGWRRRRDVQRAHPFGGVRDDAIRTPV